MDDAPVLHVGNGVCELEDAVVVGHDHDCALRRDSHTAQDVHHRVARLGVERRSGLVAHDEARLIDQRAGDRDTLLLATGQFARQCIDVVSQAELAQQLAAALRCFATRDVCREQRHGRVLCGGQSRQQVVLLKDEANVLQPECVRAAAGELLQGLAQHFDRTSGRVEQTRDHREQGGLAGAALPDEHADLAERHVPVDTAQRTHRRIAAAEHLLDAVTTHCVVRLHGTYPRNTTAGSSCTTLRMLSRLERTTTMKITAATPTAFCQSRVMPRVAVLCNVTSKKAPHSPRPIP
jgi:hypothetical protein